MPSKRPCTDQGGGARSGASQVDISERCIGQMPSINDLLPLEVIENILVETIVAQALCDMSLPDLRHDKNLAAVCPLWNQIVHGQRFREILLPQSFAKIAPKAFYRQEAYPVKIVGVNTENNSLVRAVATLKDKLYAIEGPWWAAAPSIFVYDTQPNYRHLVRSWLPKVKLELLCTNRRQLPAVDGLLLPSRILSSAQGNCLYLLSGAEYAFPRTFFKLASDGALLARWDVPNPYAYNLYVQCITAIDPSGHYLVCVSNCRGFASFVHIFTTTGSLLASIQLQGDYLKIPGIAILRDATLVVSYVPEIPFSEWIKPVKERRKSRHLYSERLVFLRARQSPDLLLQYEDLPSALSSTTSTAILPEPRYMRQTGSPMFADNRGCIVSIRSKGLILVDSERMAALAGRHRSPHGNYRGPFHFDATLGLLFFTSTGKLSACLVRQCIF